MMKTNKGNLMQPFNREILEQQIAHEKELRETHESATEKERFIQAVEYERRLTALNHAHEQAIEAQARTVPREVFDNYVKESGARVELALKTITDKYDAAHKALADEHAADMNRIDIRHSIDQTNVLKEVQNERELRKSFEGSVNTWKWIASFLGASGVAGVILLFISRIGQ